MKLTYDNSQKALGFSPISDTIIDIVYSRFV